MKFLVMLGQYTAPGLRIRLIVDNGSSRTSRATRAWIKAHPRFDVENQITEFTIGYTRPRAPLEMEVRRRR